MGVTRGVGLSPQASPLEQDPCAGSPGGWSRSSLDPAGNQDQRSPAAPSGTETGYCTTTVKREPASESTCVQETVVRKTEDMTGFMDDLTLSSPKKRESSVRSRRSCDRSSTRSSSRSSCSSRSSSSSSSSASSRSWSRSRSRSRGGRTSSRRYRRSSRSYSRSRSRSRGYARYRSRYHVRYYRRYRRSPPRYRSRSRSWSRGRSYYRRSYSRSRSRSRCRKYYGFGRTIYPEIYRSWRSRSRTRSCSRSPLHLSAKDKKELLEIAKANAAKALGTDNIILPASLKTFTPPKERKSTKQKQEDPGESAEQPTRPAGNVTKSGLERTAIQKSISFSPNNTMAKPVLQKPVSQVVKEPAVSPAREDDRKGSPYGQWVPVRKEEKKTFLNFSPKSTLFRAR
ncbi:arginine/serine-rich protein 1 [Neopsephotus bourkii]|uniref:arginine/serine-rich protein 1 n=1 Tax=Neopsephotus bourkii TaxID=309878 RepID=UPI002AA5A78D|nr:arginine/serine-rich protein 1 [Neopsephotus bourkii]